MTNHDYNENSQFICSHTANCLFDLYQTAVAHWPGLAVLAISSGAFVSALYLALA